jgi:hypothetical protein
MKLFVAQCSFTRVIASQSCNYWTEFVFYDEDTTSHYRAPTYRLNRRSKGPSARDHMNKTKASISTDDLKFLVGFTQLHGQWSPINFVSMRVPANLGDFIGWHLWVEVDESFEIAV